MARTSTYINFPRNTEEAFVFYKSVFLTEFVGEIQRLGAVPFAPGQPPLSEEDKNLIMHIVLPITGGHLLMGTDAPATMGFEIANGNNVRINLEPDTLEESNRLFNALTEGGEIFSPLQKMFWGGTFGSFKDKFGIYWMINCQQDEDE